MKDSLICYYISFDTERKLESEPGRSKGKVWKENWKEGEMEEQGRAPQGGEKGVLHGYPQSDLAFKGETSQFVNNKPVVIVR